MWFLLACTGSNPSGGDTGQTDTGPVANYTLNLHPRVPSNVNPFDEVDRIDLVFDDASGEQTRVSLDAPQSGDNASADGLPALDNTSVQLEGYAAGELVAFGQSKPLTAADTDDDAEINVFVGRPGTMGWVGNLPEDTAFAVGAAAGEGRFAILGGLGTKNSGRMGNTRATIYTLDLGSPNDDLDWEEADAEMPTHTDGDGQERRERAGATLTEISTGDDKGLYVLAGGCDGEPFDGSTSATPDVQLYNPGDNSFTAINAGDILVSARCGHAALGRTDGSVLVWGGWGFTGSAGLIAALPDGELYDAEKREFGRLDGPNDAGSYGAGLADLGEDGTIIGGGILIDDFDGDSYADWKTTDVSFRITLRGDLGDESYSGLGALAAHAMLAIGGGDVLSFGGVIADSRGVQLEATAPATDRVWRFYHGSQTWTEVGSMAMERAGHTAILVDESHVLIVGGSADWGPAAHSDAALSCAELYDIDTNTSQVIDKCSGNDDAGGMPNRSESPVALFDADLGALITGGFDGTEGAKRGTALYSLDR